MPVSHHTRAAAFYVVAVVISAIPVVEVVFKHLDSTSVATTAKQVHSGIVGILREPSFGVASLANLKTAAAVNDFVDAPRHHTFQDAVILIGIFHKVVDKYLVALYPCRVPVDHQLINEFCQRYSGYNVSNHNITIYKLTSQICQKSTNI